MKYINESQIVDLEHFNNSRLQDTIQWKCLKCDNIYSLKKRFFVGRMYQQKFIEGNKVERLCKACNDTAQQEPRSEYEDVKCACCDKVISSRKTTSRKFCSSSCAARYNNSHKKYGTRVSKLEIWLQSKLEELYPNLIILYNDKTAIGSELDIYIPSLEIAFELNGIYHYKPIHSNKQLRNIQNNDKSKIRKCSEKGIRLQVIDTTSQTIFKENTSEVFLNYITRFL